MARIPAVIAFAATRLLPKARWVYQAPGLGLAAWYAVLATVVVSGVGAALSLLARWPTTQQTVCAWWALCVDVLSGQWGMAWRITGRLVIAVFISDPADGGRCGNHRLWKGVRQRPG